MPEQPPPLITVDSNFLTRAQAAAYLGLSNATLIRWSLTGGGPVYFLWGRRTVRYAKDELEKWARSQPRAHTADVNGQAARLLTKGNGVSK